MRTERNARSKNSALTPQSSILCFPLSVSLFALSSISVLLLALNFFTVLLFPPCSLLRAPCSSAEAQQPKGLSQIGYLSGGFPSPGPNVGAFRQGLKDLGYVESKNINIVYRYA